MKAYTFNAKALEESHVEMALKVRAKEDDNILHLLDLEAVKKDLRQAKEDATQSWLDSRPLIDELEKMQAELDVVRARVFKAKANIIDLQDQLQATEMCIKSSKEEDRSLRITINDKNQEVHMMQEDMQQLKTKIDKKRRRRSKLKLVLRLKRQTLETIELTCIAIKLDSEAFATSAAQALYYINNSEATNVMIQLSQEEYECLKKEAKERIALAEWQISISEGEKVAAEKSRDLAFRRLQSLHTPNSSVRGKAIHDEDEAFLNEEHKEILKGGMKKLPSRVKMMQDPPRNINSFHVVNNKKGSIFFRIKTFIIQRLAKYFK